MNDETVPFGKYRGQPVEVLQNDKQYCDWLSGQDWFRDKYQNIFNVIVNNFAEPSETPEHNAIQVMFLDEDFCARVMTLARKGSEYKYNIIKVVFETANIDVLIVDERENTQSPRCHTIEIKTSMGDDYPSVIRQIKSAKENGFSKYRDGEPSKIGKEILSYGIFGCRRGDSVILIDKYTGTGATREQMVKTFEMSGISVVWLEEVKKSSSEMGE